MGKVVPLRKLKDKKEYDATLKMRNNIGKRIAWLNDDRIDHVGIIDSSIQVLEKRRADDPKMIGEQINILDSVRSKILKGQYKTELMNEFEAFTAQIKQYEYSQEKKPFTEIIKCVFSGELKLGDYLEKQNFITRINRYGIVSMPNNGLWCQSPEEVFDDIMKNYDFVGIKHEQLALVPSDEYANYSKMRKSVEERLKVFSSEAFNNLVLEESERGKTKQKSDIMNQQEPDNKIYGQSKPVRTERKENNDHDSIGNN